LDFHFMSYDFTDTPLLVAAFLLVILSIVAVAAFLDRRSARTMALHSRFGSEHARAVDEHGSPREAEAELTEREIA